MKWDTSVPVCNLNQEIVSYRDGLDKHSYSRPDHHLYGYTLQLSISNLVLHNKYITYHVFLHCQWDFYSSYYQYCLLFHYW